MEVFIRRSLIRLLPIITVVLSVLLPVPVSGEMWEEKGVIILTSKGARWLLQFPGEGFKLQIEKHKEDGLSHYYYFNHSFLNLNVSFYIEPVNKCTSSEECRSLYWKNPRPAIVNPQGVNFFDLNNFSVVEFIVPTFKGMKVDQMNMSAHHVRDGFWVDMHISKVLYKPKDRAMFIDFIKAISFKEKK